MKTKMLVVIIAHIWILGLAMNSLADMESESYRITTSTMSGGGGTMGSANYQTSSTLGQSSPLMDPSDQPGSESYWLFPGFWYTLPLGCDYDFYEDGDVDGEDLAEFAEGFETVFEAFELEFFAEEFGKIDCFE
jgi:hypothetical protein